MRKSTEQKGTGLETYRRGLGLVMTEEMKWNVRLEM